MHLTAGRCVVWVSGAIFRRQVMADVMRQIRRASSSCVLARSPAFFAVRTARRRLGWRPRRAANRAENRRGLCNLLVSLFSLSFVHFFYLSPFVLFVVCTCTKCQVEAVVIRLILSFLLYSIVFRVSSKMEALPSTLFLHVAKTAKSKKLADYFAICESTYLSPFVLFVVCTCTNVRLKLLLDVHYNF